MFRVHRNLDGYLKNYPRGAPLHYKPSSQILDLARKWLADTKVLANKHSSFLQKSLNYVCKKFYSTGPWRFVSQGQTG